MLWFKMKGLNLKIICLMLTTSMGLASCAQVNSVLGRQQTDPLAKAEKVTVTKGTIENRIIATGKITAKTTSSVAFPRAGVIAKILVSEGDKVKAGQPLAIQETSDLKLTAQQQYANYISAQAAYSLTIKGPTAQDVASAKASLDSAQAAYNDLFKKPTYNETGSLLATMNNAKVTLESRKLAAEGKSQDINSLRATLANAEATLRQRQTEAAGSSQDINNLKATLANAEATLKTKQASYDRAYKANPAGIGGSPAGLELEQATNNYQVAKANYDKSFDTARLNLEKAQNDYAAAKANLERALDNAKLDYSKAQNDYSAAIANYNKAFDKPKDGTIANAQSQVTAAKTKLENLTPAEETIAQQKAKVDQTYAAWQSAEDNVVKATIVAPFDGLVTAVKVGVGDWANTGATAAQVAEFAEPIFEADVDETDLGNIKVGNDARVRLQTFPDTPLTAKVRSVATVGTSTSNVVNYKVKLGVGQGLDGTSPTVLLNMSGTAEVITAKADNALLVSPRALSIDPTTKTYSVQKYVAGVNRQAAKAEKMPVKLGFRGADQVQLLDGVNEGDVLIIPTQLVQQQQGPPQGN